MAKKILLTIIIVFIFCSCKDQKATVYTIDNEVGYRNIISYGTIICDEVITESVPMYCEDYTENYCSGQSIRAGDTLATYILNGKQKQLKATNNGLICEKHKSNEITYFNLDKSTIATYISESDIKHIKIGDSVTIKGEGLIENSYKGTISTISSTAKNSENGTFVECIVIFDKPDTSIVPGFSVKVECSVAIENSVNIPIEAINHDDKGYYVTIINNSKYIKKYIDNIILNNGEYTVCSGLKSGEKILIHEK